MRTLLVALTAAAAALLPASPGSAVAAPAVLAGCVGQDIGLFPPDGGPPTVLAREGGEPDVSPDGQRVAYVDFTDKFGVITVIDVATRMSRTLSGTETFGAPDWAPDGHTLAIESRGEVSGIGLVDVDEPDPEVHMVPGSAGMFGPEWSPDGAYLAAGSGDGVVVITPDGRNREVVAPKGSQPAWSPDGRTLLFTTLDTDIHARSLPDLAERPFLVSPGYRARYVDPAWSPDGYYVYGTLAYDYTDPDHPTTPAPWGTTMVRKAWTSTNLYDGDPSYRTADNTRCPSLGGGVRPQRDTTAPDAVPLSLRPLPSRIEVSATLPGPSDVAGVRIRYAVGAVAPATPADGLDGGRSLLGHATLQQLAASTTYSVTVFPIDWSGNVGPGTSATTTTPAEVATLLAVSPHVRDLVAGQSVEVGGQLRREDDGTPIVDAPVDLLAHRAGQPDTLIATLRTDANGRVSSRRSPLAPTRYTLRYAGAGELLPASGTSLAVVSPQVRLTLSRNPVRRGAVTTLLMQVRPPQPGLNMRVYQERNGRVVLSPLVRLDADSSARVRLDTRNVGSYVIEVQTGSNRDLAPRLVWAPTLTVR